MESDNTDIKWALDLLSPDPLYSPNFYAKYWLQIPALFVTPLAVGYINHIRGLKFLARPQYHLGFTAGFYLLANVVDDYFKKRYARRDALLRDYVRLHPEDFPPPVRKTYGELFHEWVPIR